MSFSIIATLLSTTKQINLTLEKIDNDIHRLILHPITEEVKGNATAKNDDAVKAVSAALNTPMVFKGSFTEIEQQLGEAIPTLHEAREAANNNLEAILESLKTASKRKSTAKAPSKASTSETKPTPASKKPSAPEKPKEEEKAETPQATMSW